MLTGGSLLASSALAGSGSEALVLQVARCACAGVGVIVRVHVGAVHLRSGRSMPIERGAAL